MEKTVLSRDGFLARVSASLVVLSQPTSCKDKKDLLCICGIRVLVYSWTWCALSKMRCTVYLQAFQPSLSVGVLAVLGDCGLSWESLLILFLFEG